MIYRPQKNCELFECKNAQEVRISSIYVKSMLPCLYGKLILITTDPETIGNPSDFVALSKGDNDFADFMDYDCPIHPQVVAFKTVNYIRCKRLSGR